jgi:hypothetical protein
VAAHTIASGVGHQSLVRPRSLNQARAHHGQAVALSGIRAAPPNLVEACIRGVSHGRLPAADEARSSAARPLHTRGF